MLFSQFYRSKDQEYYKIEQKRLFLFLFIFLDSFFMVRILGEKRYGGTGLISEKNGSFVGRP